MCIGYAYQPPALCTYRTHRAACLQGPTYCTYGVRVPASGVGYVQPRTACRGTPGETHDIGLAAVYLASAAGGYVNAETLVVDGGHWHDSARAFWQGREALRAMSQQRRSKL